MGFLYKLILANAEKLSYICISINIKYFDYVTE